MILGFIGQFFFSMRFVVQWIASEKNKNFHPFHVHKFKLPVKRIMNENLIVEDNTIYEIDPECLKKKRKCQGETGEKVETENTKKQKMQRRNR